MLPLKGFAEKSGRIKQSLDSKKTSPTTTPVGTWLQEPLRPEGHCGCPDFSFLSHGEPEDKIVKVLVLLPDLRRILNLGDKKLRKSGPASWKDEQNVPAPLGNEEEHWKSLRAFQGPSLPSALSFSIPSWSGTAWSIVLEGINESNLFSTSLKG